MPLSIWTEKSGHSFGVFTERIAFEQPLPVINDFGVTYTKIAGNFPVGVRISGNRLIGTPIEVVRDTVYTFCIRASLNGNISDRTFNLTVTGPDVPTVLTPEGNLHIGEYGQLFVLDQSFVNFQIETIDPDLAAGQQLSYFIARDDGELPKGLTLTKDGRIIGYIEPTLTINPSASGTYDTTLFDEVAFDFGFRPTNGFDSFVYDRFFYDYFIPIATPKHLNRNYGFTVTITDGDTVVKKTFKIFVVGDDYFRADNTYIFDGTGLFTADVTYLHAPVWVTASNLGTVRANNYVLFKLDVYDTDQIFYEIDNVAYLPPGMQFDINTGEVFGRIPYQPAITKTYSFTVTATRYGDADKPEDIAQSPRTFTVTVIGEIDSVITWNTPSNLGDINANFISVLRVNASTTVTDAVLLYKITSGYLPPGLSLSLDGEIIGKVTQIALTTFDHQSGLTTFDETLMTIDRKFTFTVEAKDQFGYSAISRIFSIFVNIPHEISFSNIKVKPYLIPAQRELWSSFINDSSIFTASSIFRPGDSNFGIQRDLSMVIYAGIETAFIAEYISAIGLNHKRKRFRFDTVKKAIATLPESTSVLYEIIYISMIDPLEPNGKVLPNKLKLSHNFDTIQSDSSTSIWSTKLSDLSIAAPFNVSPEPFVTVDSTGYHSSDSLASVYYPNSVSNWRKRLKNVGETERNYLPIWMRTAQPGTRAEPGFTLAIPLCYCKVGTADDILLNIKYSDFDFRQIDYTVDRYIIDSVKGDASDKYLVFKNERITI